MLIIILLLLAISAGCGGNGDSVELKRESNRPAANRYASYKERADAVTPDMQRLTSTDEVSLSVDELIALVINPSMKIPRSIGGYNLLGIADVNTSYGRGGYNFTSDNAQIKTHEGKIYEIILTPSTDELTTTDFLDYVRNNAADFNADFTEQPMLLMLEDSVSILQIWKPAFGFKIILQDKALAGKVK